MYFAKYSLDVTNNIFFTLNPTVTTNPSANLASPTSASVMEYTPDGGCHIYRYGHYKAVISILGKYINK